MIVDKREDFANILRTLMLKREQLIFHLFMYLDTTFLQRVVSRICSLVQKTTPQDSIELSLSSHFQVTSHISSH